MFIGHAAVALAAKPLAPRASLGLLLAAAVAIYVRSAPARDRTGAFAFWGLVGFLLLAYAANIIGPPPPSVSAIGYVGFAGGALFAVWAWWADRHRGVMSRNRPDLI